MSMRPQSAMASAAIALSSAFLVTSAMKAEAVPPFSAIISTVSSAEARLWSTQSTLAPSRAKVRAVARPLPMPSPGLCPAPTTIAVRSFSRMSRHSRHRVLLQYLFIIRLIVDLHGGEDAHHGAVEGDGKHEVDHLFIGEMALDIGKGRLRHRKLARHLARALEDRPGQWLRLRFLALGLRHHPGNVVVGDAESPADLHMMGELIFRLLQPADLQDGKLAQPRIELALEADVTADAVEGARHVGRIDQQLVQVGVAPQHVAIVGRDLVGLEIGQAGHAVSSLCQCSCDSRSGACNVTPPSTTSTWPVM